ncbi:uncharacterized protein LOC111072611 [Drosophila obscura]|nr:uncharacterized protein LOC111072611 [Drosophila obscura]
MCWATIKERQECINCSSSSSDAANNSNQNHRECAPSNKINSASEFL